MKKVTPKEAIKGLSRDAYDSVPSNAIRMDQNTLPYFNRRAFLRGITKCSRDGLNLYRAADAPALRRSLASKYMVSADSVVAGNGSDELIDLIFKAFLQQGERVAIPRPTFGMYSHFATVNGASVGFVPLSLDFQLDAKAVIQSGAKIAIIGSPNNPTGNAFSTDSILDVVEGFDGLVVIDEAYAEFCRQNLAHRAVNYGNLLVLRTFSKAYGLAGIRVGYCIGNSELIDVLLKIKAPFNVSTMSEEIAIEALKDVRFLRDSVRKVLRDRKILAEGLSELDFAVTPSDSNFIFARPPRNSLDIWAALKDRGIFVRKIAWPEDEYSLRITVGTPAQNKLLLSALGKIVRRCG